MSWGGLDRLVVTQGGTPTTLPVALGHFIAWDAATIEGFDLLGERRQCPRRLHGRWSGLAELFLEGLRVPRRHANLGRAYCGPFCEPDRKSGRNELEEGFGEAG
jgi:hypothetical protein